ncbi:hypothetical protein SNEBB_008948 [Seison nebaliae]|nr:hypothetical protein SNEBB_008948 [Seison nebaliae]
MFHLQIKRSNGMIQEVDVIKVNEKDQMLKVQFTNEKGLAQGKFVYFNDVRCLNENFDELLEEYIGRSDYSTLPTFTENTMYDISSTSSETIDRMKIDHNKFHPVSTTGEIWYKFDKTKEYFDEAMDSLEDLMKECKEKKCNDENMFNEAYTIIQEKQDKLNNKIKDLSHFISDNVEEKIISTIDEDKIDDDWGITVEESGKKRKSVQGDKNDVKYTKVGRQLPKLKKRVKRL